MGDRQCCDFEGLRNSFGKNAKFCVGGFYGECYDEDSSCFAQTAGAARPASSTTIQVWWPRKRSCPLRLLFGSRLLFFSLPKHEPPRPHHSPSKMIPHQHLRGGMMNPPPSTTAPLARPLLPSRELPATIPAIVPTPHTPDARPTCSRGRGPPHPAYFLHHCSTPLPPSQWPDCPRRRKPFSIKPQWPDCPRRRKPFSIKP